MVVRINDMIGCDRYKLVWKMHSKDSININVNLLYCFGETHSLITSKKSVYGRGRYLSVSKSVCDTISEYHIIEYHGL